MNIILLDLEANWLNLLPLSFTRPIGKFRVGVFTLDEKWRSYLGFHCSFITEDYLSDKFPVHISDDNYIINSVILPDENLAREILKLEKNEALFSKNTFLAVRVGSDKIEKVKNLEFNGFAIREFDKTIHSVLNIWDIFLLNGDEIKKDIEIIKPGIKPFSLSKTNVIIGNPEDLIIDENVSAECVVFNVTDGPVYIGRNALIMEGSMIKGPASIGDNSIVKMGARIYQGTTIGPSCRAAGEINNSVFFGNSNKAHDGFLGNSVLGEWCNLGADTNNSNLKNNYDIVKVWNYKSKSFVNTGQTFCGLFMADHSKCSINTMFNTGTVVGVSANIFGSGFPRTFIPSFSWGGSAGFTDYNIEKAIETAIRVMQRRNIILDDIDKRILRTIYEKTIEYRNL